MPIFEVQGPDGNTYEVDAPDMNAAAGAFAPAEKVSTDRAAGRQAVKESMKAEPEYIEVPVLGPDGSATGQTERVLKPSKADPIGRGAMSVFPFGEDIAAMARSGALPTSAEHSAEKERILGEAEAAKAAYPKPYLAGQAGSIAAQMYGMRNLPLPGMKWGAEALPEGAALGERAIAAGKRIAGAGVGGATMGGITGLGEGTDVGDRLKHGALGTLVGGVVGSGLGAGIEGAGALGSYALDRFGRPIYQAVRGAFAPETVATEKVAGTMERSGLNMQPDEFRQRLMTGEPLMVGDVGGRETKDLARTVSNISPEAHTTLEAPLRSRFESQAERLKGDVESYLPDSPDYVKKIDALKEAAKKANDPAYKKAYDEGSIGVFNDALYDLAQAPQVKKAMQEANEIAKNQEAYGETRGKIVSPFDFDKNGTLIARPGMNASDANLAYWDLVQRRLRGPIQGLKMTDAEAAGRLSTLHRNLVDAIDDIVPSFKTARSTAAEGFGATDAYEAGINYAKATDPKKVSELNALIPKLTADEQELFQHGFIFQKLGDISRSGDTRDLTKKAFLGGSPLEREKLGKAVDPILAEQLEARISGERLMNQLNEAVRGGSTTARQQRFSDLAQFGAAGVTGATVGALGDSSKEGTAAGIAAMLLKKGKGKVDADVANRIARILVSQDPKLLDRLTVMAQRNDQIVPALRILEEQPKGWMFDLIPKSTRPANIKRTIAEQSAMKAAEEKEPVRRAP